jgi:hypothetical protein
MLNPPIIQKIAKTSTKFHWNTDNFTFLAEVLIIEQSSLGTILTMIIKTPLSNGHGL